MRNYTFAKVSSGSARSGTALATIAEFGRTALQALLLVALARVLGVSGFGQFFGILAVFQFAQPFAWAGSLLLIVQIIAQKKMSTAEATARSLMTVFWGGSLGVLVMSATLWPLFFRETDLVIFVLLACSELIFFGIPETLGYAFLAEKKYWYLIAMRVTTSGLRLLLLGVLLFIGTYVDVRTWAMFYLLASALGSVISVAIAAGPLALRLTFRGLPWRFLREGFNFAVAGTASFAQDNLDKPMVLSLAGSAPSAYYAAGYRVLSVAMVPLRALMQVTYPNYFRLGTAGLPATLAFAKRILLIATVYALLVGVVMVAISNPISALFGEGFEETSQVVQLLAVVPLIRCFSYVYGDALTGAGRQRDRSIMIVGSSSLNLALNAFLIPLWGWRGAAFSTVVAEILLSLGCISRCLWVSRVLRS